MVSFNLVISPVFVLKQDIRFQFFLKHFNLQYYSDSLERKDSNQNYILKLQILRNELE